MIFLAIESKINDKRAVVMGQVQSLMQELEEKREADKRMVEEFRVRLQRMVSNIRATLLNDEMQRKFIDHVIVSSHSLILTYLYIVVF